MWEHALKSNPNKEIIGVREVVEVIENNLISKLKLGFFKWYTYKQIESEINKIVDFFTKNNVVKAEKVVIFADTRKEWMVTALACFKFGFSVVNVYSKLGCEAVAYASMKLMGNIFLLMKTN